VKDHGSSAHGFEVGHDSHGFVFDATAAVAIEREIELGLGLLDMAVNDAGHVPESEATTGFVIEQGPGLGLDLLGTPVNDAGHVSEATAGVVVERGPRFGLGLPGMLVNDAAGPGMLVNDADHACGIEESNRTTAAAWVVALAGMAVRKCEGVRSAVHAVQKVDVAKEPDTGVSSVTEVVFVVVFV
jgi:hypothetical protein